MNSQERLFSSTELTTAVGCTRKALRVYQEHGLIAPIRDRGNRRYGAEAYRRLGLIVALRSTGMSIAEVKRLLDAQDQGTVPGPQAQALAGELATLVKRISDRMQALSLVRERLNAAREDLATGVAASPG
jgi:DNA-binding transcriptional MerR regulator